MQLLDAELWRSSLGNLGRALSTREMSASAHGPISSAFPVCAQKCFLVQYLHSFVTCFPEVFKFIRPSLAPGGSSFTHM